MSWRLLYLTMPFHLHIDFAISEKIDGLTCRIDGIYGAMAVTRRFICSLTGIDASDGSDPPHGTIFTGLGYKTTPIMALDQHCLCSFVLMTLKLCRHNRREDRLSLQLPIMFQSRSLAQKWIFLCFPYFKIGNPDN